MNTDFKQRMLTIKDHSPQKRRRIPLTRWAMAGLFSLSSVLPSISQAGNIDLSTWRQEGPLINGNWVLSDNHKYVYQTINGAPTFYVSPNAFINGTILGQFGVSGTGDDDYIGFVFGYSSENKFLLFDWKQGIHSPKDTGKEGYGLLQFNDSSYHSNCFWRHQHNPPGCNIVATDYGSGKGWEHWTTYFFELDYRTDRVIIKVGSHPDNMSTIFDISGDFEPGQFGFYNFSQIDVFYGDFTSEGGLVAAKDDNYIIDHTRLNVSSLNGITTNDSGATLNGLTAELGTSPTHGDLSLNPDGSFSYITDSLSCANDSFTYRVHDGFQYSDYATVNLTISDLVASQLQRNGDTLSVRVDNTSSIPVPAGVTVRFYENNPIDGDKFLGDVSMGRLEVGASQTIVLDNVGELTKGATLYAFVDTDEVVSECNEFNNTAWQGPSPTTAAPAECKFYAINDKGKNQSQFLVFDVDSRIENFIVRDVGPLYKGYDIEGLSIDPTNYRIYVTSGVDVGAGKLPGQLYAVDAQTGALIPIGPTGFEEVDSLTFAADGTLWGWAKENGLITINLKTGQGTLELPADVEVEDLAAAKTETLIFYGAVNTDLWRFQPDTNTLEVVCENLPGETESLEMLSEKLVLLGTHGGDKLQVFDIEACQTTNAIRIPTGTFKDIEGIGVIEEQCPLGEMVETALNMIENEPEGPVCLSLEQFETGDSVEGFDTLYPGLSLMTAADEHIVISEGEEPIIYSGNGRINWCIDKAIADEKRYHNYTFILESGLTFKDFSLRLFDFGDLNPSNASEHTISLVGYDDQEQRIAKDTLSYTLLDGQAYRDGEYLGTGDACLDDPGQLGRYQYQIAGSGISKVKLKFDNDKTGQQPSDPAFAIGDLCFTLERLPIQLLRHLPKNYVSDHVNDFIDQLRHDRMGQFERWEIIENLVALQSQFFSEYINGLPGGFLQEFFDEKLHRDLNGKYSDYPSELVTEILEEFPQEFQDKFRAEFPHIEETVKTHLLTTQAELIDRYERDKRFYFGGEIPIDGLRNVLSDETGDMMGNLITELVTQSSDDSLLDVLDTLPSYILDKMLDNHEE